MEAHPANNTNNIQDIVSRLLETRHVSKVYYVDEDFDSRGYKANLMSYVRTHHSDENFQFKSEDPEIAVKEFVLWWDSYDNEESSKMDLIHKLGIQRVRTKAEQRLSLIIDKDKLDCISPEEFESKHIENGLNEDCQILVLMDQELKGYDKNGFDILKKYDNHNFIQCGLFSGTFGKDEEIVKWKELCDFSPCIYPLSKIRVTGGNQSEIVEGLRNVLWLRQISEIKRLYTSTVSNALKETFSYINQIDPASFDSIVMKKSLNEGCWEFDTFHRIGLATLNEQVEKHVLKNDIFVSFQASTTALRSIESIVSKNIPNNDTQLAHDIICLERYENGEYINQTYSQLCNGDIISIGKDLFMLLCQPCNLEIRKNGNRKAKELLHIVPMVKQTKTLETARKELESFQKKKEELIRDGKYEELAQIANDYNFGEAIPDDDDIKNQHNGVLKYNNDFYLLRYNEAVVVDARVLDLVSYNKDGKVELEIEEDALSSIIQPNMKKRFNNLKASIEEIVDNSSAENAIVDIAAVSIKQGRISAEIIDKLNITRVARLKDPWAQEYLQEFMAYLSRPAYPMDLE